MVQLCFAKAAYRSAAQSRFRSRVIIFSPTSVICYPLSLKVLSIRDYNIHFLVKRLLHIITTFASLIKKTSIFYAWVKSRKSYFCVHASSNRSVYIIYLFNLWILLCTHALYEGCSIETIITTEPSLKNDWRTLSCELYEFLQSKLSSVQFSRRTVQSFAS